MRYQLVLFFVLLTSLATAVFSGGQVSHFFTQKQAAVGSWSPNVGQAFTLDTSLSEKTAGQVLGANVNSIVANTADKKIEYSAISYQGFLFDKYLQMRNSPLAGHGEDFVQACRKYNAPSDCLLLIAISKIETDYCRTGISAKQFNCWGFGGGPANRIVYKNFPEAIDNITRRLMSGYGEAFFRNPNRGELSYCGAHCNRWGDHVLDEMRRINNYFKSQGHPGLI